MTKKSAISRSQCGLMIDGPDLDVGLIGRSWIRVGRYKGSSLVDESPSIYLIPPQSACHLNVPSPPSLLLLSPLSVNSTNVSSSVRLLGTTFGDVCMPVVEGTCIRPSKKRLTDLTPLSQMMTSLKTWA